MTGESIPVEKHEPSGNGNGLPTQSPEAAAPGRSQFDLRNVCFMGTNVVSGTASAVVVTTGNHTALGSLAKAIVGKRAMTSFDRGVNSVSWLLIRFMMVMVPLVFVINGLTKHNWTEAFFFALAVAVGLTPEMLPMIVTANLARGALAMSRHKVIVKNLNAIQNMGAMDVLCTDKTRTLTRDKVILERHLNIYGETDPEVLKYGYLNSFYQTGLKNLLDIAVLEHGELRHELRLGEDYRKIDEIPFDFLRRRMSVVVEKQHGQQLLICKGAVEEVMSITSEVRSNNQVLPLDDELRHEIKSLTRSQNEEGMRVLAVAYKEMAEPKFPYAVADELGMVLAGFLSFLDPPKETAGEAIRKLEQQGVQIKVLTGDNETVTRKICKEVGLHVEEAMLGSVLEAKTDEELDEIVESTTVFAKLSPVEKSRVIKALKRKGHTELPRRRH